MPLTRIKSTAIETGGITTAKIADDAVTTAKVADTVNLGRRNLIINGAMQVWQRGTSFAAGGGIVWTADRFWRYLGTSGNIERSTDAPTGFAYSLHANTTGIISGGTNYEIERSGFFPQRKYVYSFYMKGDFSNTYLAVNFRNTVGNVTDEVPITLFSAGNGNGFGNYSDWTRVEKVIDTTGYTPHVNNKIFDLEFGNFAAGGKITGIQLEVGEIATPFEHLPYSESLALCQRYYQVVVNNTFREYIYNVHRHPVPNRVTMRTAPTITVNHDGSGGPTGGVDTGYATADSFVVAVNTTSVGGSPGSTQMVDIVNLDMYADAEI